MLEQFCVAISTENSAIQNENAIKINKYTAIYYASKTKHNWNRKYFA